MAADPDVVTVESTDGTRIGCRRSGDGPPLLWVHGMASDHREVSWSVAPWLEPHFTVWAMDRRGRGASGDGPRYVIEREFEDVAAVVDAIGGPVDVFGMSFGATVALGALPLTANLGRAVLYDPGAFVGDDIASWADDLEPMLAAGQREEILAMLYRAVFPPDEPPPRVPVELDPAVVPTIPRESRAQDFRPFDPRPYAAVDTPVLLLTGSESNARHRRTVDAAHAALRRSRVVVLEGHGHAGLFRAPELIARHVLAFLRDETPSPGGR